eukprot:6100798-Pleurochrysis_carterae.AAC.2
MAYVAKRSRSSAPPPRASPPPAPFAAAASAPAPAPTPAPAPSCPPWPLTFCLARCLAGHSFVAATPSIVRTRSRPQSMRVLATPLDAHRPATPPQMPSTT